MYILYEMTHLSTEIDIEKEKQSTDLCINLIYVFPRIKIRERKKRYIEANKRQKKLFVYDHIRSQICI